MQCSRVVGAAEERQGKREGERLDDKWRRSVYQAAVIWRKAAV
jgi:hypothetical protein